MPFFLFLSISTLYTVGAILYTPQFMRLKHISVPNQQVNPNFNSRYMCKYSWTLVLVIQYLNNTYTSIV
jgi:hypothetical protein